jgi:hypothetical protein
LGHLRSRALMHTRPPSLPLSPSVPLSLSFFPERVARTLRAARRFAEITLREVTFQGTIDDLHTFFRLRAPFFVFFPELPPFKPSFLRPPYALYFVYRSERRTPDAHAHAHARSAGGRWRSKRPARARARDRGALRASGGGRPGRDSRNWRAAGQQRRGRGAVRHQAGRFCVARKQRGSRCGAAGSLWCVFWVVSG